MKRLLSITLLIAAMLSMLTVGAQAADYDFVTDGTPEYYDSTSYEEVYGSLYGDNVFEKDGIRRDRTGDGEKTRCLCGKRGIFNRDGPAMGPQIIRQLE